MKPTHNLPDGEWLVSGGLIYRLRDGVNCDEINVAMVDGSRDTDRRHEKAAAILVILAAPVQPAVEAAKLPTDISKRLRSIGVAAFTEPSRIIDKLMLDAADEIERYYGGMMAWKKCAEDAARPVPPEGQEAPLPDATLWMTNESKWRLEKGGNCKGAVPAHGKRSATATIPLFTAKQMCAHRAAPRLSLPVEALTDEQIEAAFHLLDGKKLIVGENQLNWNKVVRLAFARAILKLAGERG